MADEIERKFLVPEIPPPSTVGTGARLRQGYLAVDGAVEVRIRLTTSGAQLTVKAGGGLSRTEVEVALGGDDAADLWPHTEGRRIEKARHRIPLEGGLVAELDVYEGALGGLLTVEVEFAESESALAFAPPSWFGAELTGRPGWSNAELARHGRPDP